MFMVSHKLVYIFFLKGRASEKVSQANDFVVPKSFCGACVQFGFEWKSNQRCGVGCWHLNTETSVKFYLRNIIILLSDIIF